MKHLFLTPRIRTSSYVEMLAAELPGLRNSPRGDIQEPVLPDLVNLAVVDNQDAFKDELDKLNVKSLIDWRDVMLWREDTQEYTIQKEISRSLHKDDVINLQFTRYVHNVVEAAPIVLRLYIAALQDLPRPYQYVETRPPDSG